MLSEDDVEAFDEALDQALEEAGVPVTFWLKLHWAGEAIEIEYVQADCPGQGAGTRAMALAFELADRLGRDLVLRVVNERGGGAERLQRFYERCGFSRTGRDHQWVWFERQHTPAPSPGGRSP